MKTIEQLKVQIYADGADFDTMLRLHKNPLIKGFTTNPSLMRSAGVESYEHFARELLAHIEDRPVSFEVFADDIDDMIAQAKEIASWGENVYVKLPVTNTRGEFVGQAIEELSGQGVKLNVTALMTAEQVARVLKVLDPDTPAIISVFAGRIADTGVDPKPVMKACKALMASHPKAELLWASTRELLNVFEAEECESSIITVTSNIIDKFGIVNKDLYEYSLETVQMFFNDAQKSGYTLNTEREKIVKAA
ncbi:MAG: transaldolase [Bdellovibrionales bacterium]